MDKLLYLTVVQFSIYSIVIIGVHASQGCSDSMQNIDKYLTLTALMHTLLKLHRGVGQGLFLLFALMNSQLSGKTELITHVKKGHKERTHV